MKSFFRSLKKKSLKAKEIGEMKKLFLQLFVSVILMKKKKKMLKNCKMRERR